MSYLPTLPFKLLKPFGTPINWSISNLSTSDLKLAKSVFQAKSDASTHAAFLNLQFLDKSNSTFILASQDFGFGEY